MISCYETGLPYCLDPHTLNTLGPDDLGGQLKLRTLAAHFRLDMENDVSILCVCCVCVCVVCVCCVVCVFVCVCVRAHACVHAVCLYMCAIILLHYFTPLHYRD